MKYWIIGRNGLVASDLLKYLESLGVEYAATTHEEVDILNEIRLRQFCNSYHPTHVFNCSAVVEVDKCENEKKDLAYQVNVEGVGNLARVAKECGARVVHISTDFVFDGEKGGAYREEDETNPINVYGVTKLQGERELFGTLPRATCIRTSWLYGIAKPGHVSFNMDKLREKESIAAAADLASSPTNTEDLAKALFHARDLDGIYHFANRGVVTRKGFVEEIWRLAKKYDIATKCAKIEDITQSQVGAAARRPKCSALNSEKIAGHLPFAIRTWQEALEDHIRLYYTQTENL